ncbi:MAG: nucleotidyltransferase domain-containing protein [Candidatus Eiseniibacteriota bacterium]
MSEPTITRQTIIEALGAAVEAAPFVRAAWLGGSDATGRTDRWSDIDLQLVAEDDRIEETYACVHDALEGLSPIELRYRFPMPTWHGHEQEILKLAGSDPWSIIDLVIIARSHPDRFLERERHGEPRVLLDRDGLVVPAALDRDAHLARLQARLATLRVTFPLFQSFATKAALRGHTADALQSYQAFTMRPLIELLRMRHCPERFDYGARYLDRDLPEALREEIETLVLVPALEELESRRQRAATLFDAQIRALDAGEWSPERALDSRLAPGR